MPLFFTNSMRTNPLYRTNINIIHLISQQVNKYGCPSAHHFRDRNGAKSNLKPGP
ncbi:unnamed protein product [Amoebophrya sp. A120]|nr:unnamed protein product [Amoebophrya sp. A120]|eukprot:GSA120T00018714001.1